MTHPARPSAYPTMVWRCRDFSFDLTRRVLVMGVVNVTPDSFSDGGEFLEPSAALDHAQRLVEEGADVLDFGAESTRPGSTPVPAEEQLRRLMPVLEGVASRPGRCVSVDTANAVVAERVLAAGASVINDVSALRDPEMASTVAAAGAGLVLMHMRGTPATMQDDPRYQDVAREVGAYLSERLEAATRAGIESERVALDPGIGFGKTVDHNLAVLARLDEIAALGRPVVVGASRKSFLGKLLDLPVDRRLEGGLSAAAVAVFLGARVVRTHDVAATVRAVQVASALREAQRSREKAGR